MVVVSLWYCLVFFCFVGIVVVEWIEWVFVWCFYLYVVVVGGFGLIVLCIGGGYSVIYVYGVV